MCQGERVMFDREEAQQLIDDCLKRDDKLSAWEADFLDSIQDQLTDKGFLSDKQMDTLNNIWEKVT